MSGEVNCPVHGTHGALYSRKCWYCANSGLIPPVPAEDEAEEKQEEEE